MTTLKQGDLIKNSNGETRKVLGVCGEVVHVSYPNAHARFSFTETVASLKGRGFTRDTPAWQPAKNGDEYWFIYDSGEVVFSTWNNDSIDHARRDFFGIYQTRELAEEVLLEIKRKLGK